MIFSIIVKNVFWLYRYDKLVLQNIQLQDEEF